MSRHGTYDPKFGLLPDDDFPAKPTPPTNADRIRAMTDEELANMIGTHDCLDCPLDNEDDWCIGAGRSCTDKVLNWLKSPAEVEE